MQLLIKNFGNFLLGRTFEQPRDPRYGNQDCMPVGVPSEIILKKNPVDGIELREGMFIVVESEDRTMNGGLRVVQTITYLVKDHDSISFMLELQAVSLSEK